MLETLLNFWYSQFEPSIPEDYRLTLSRHSAYYRRLSADNQQRFDHRLFLLLKFMNFIPRGFPAVSREMKVIIGGAIIQATFGLKEYRLKRFNTVYILPQAYRYPGYSEAFLGHVDFSRQFICLSWADVRQGFHIPDDAVNVALHEVAHCLEAEARFSWLSRRFFDDAHWAGWARRAAVKLAVIRNNEHRFLKTYAGRNMREMFAVCVETFFEKPEAFKHKLPGLYQALSLLLNQDPANGEDPVVVKGG